MPRTADFEHRIRVVERSRPLRFSFLLRGLHDTQRFRQGVQLHAMFWGGVFSCFIPIYRRRPGWWQGRISGSEITSGYLAAFEPDFIVATDEELASHIGFDPERLLLVNDLIDEHDGGTITHGIGVDELFMDLYEEEYQYKRRFPPTIRFPQSTARADDLLIATVFGSFPAYGPGPLCERMYRKVFDASDLPITAEEFLDVLLAPVGFPLRMGAQHLHVRHRRYLGEERLFFLDPRSTLDLVDFWNLRALGADPIPIPLPWFSDLSARLGDFAESRVQDHEGTPLPRVTAVCARSLDDGGVRECIHALNVDHPGTVLFQPWYPRLWDPFGRDKDFVLRAEVTASQEEFEVTTEGQHIDFRASPLPVEVKVSSARRVASVSVVSLYDYTGASGVATVFPPGLTSGRDVLRPAGFDQIWFSSEGIVASVDSVTDRFFWRLPSASEVCRIWFEQHDLSFQLSSAGKLALEAVRRIGGITGSGVLANEGIIRLLKRMAGRPDRPRYTPSKRDLIGRLRRTLGSNARAKNSLDHLIARHVLEVGLELQCSHCDQRTWYRLAGLDHTLQCHRCLQEYPFPSTDPPLNPWRYRVVGPFAVENYMQGGFSLLLATRLLSGMTSSVRSNAITWCPSFCLEGKPAGLGEFDGLVAVSQNEPYTGSVSVVFMEAKSYNTFDEADVDRMKQLGDIFPGSFLAFATLKDHLDDEEVALLTPLATRGREPISAGHWKNPVLILTGQELLSLHTPPTCWDDLPEHLKGLEDRHRARSSLLDLSDATQQIHLGMESYGDWIRARWDGA